MIHITSEINLIYPIIHHVSPLPLPAKKTLMKHDLCSMTALYCTFPLRMTYLCISYLSSHHPIIPLFINIHASNELSEMAMEGEIF